MNDELHTLQRRYRELLSTYVIDRDTLDYARLDAHLPYLENLDRIGRAVVSVFDLATFRHPYKSPRYMEKLGVSRPLASPIDDGLESLMHPEDLQDASRVGYHFMKRLIENGYFSDPTHYKLINDYRIRKTETEWIRVSETHQVLETDSNHRPWLIMSVVELSAEQDVELGFRSRLVDTETGAVEPFHDLENPLSERETELLSLLARGDSSKDIAARWFLSRHTVNTHRQNILRKLDVANTTEAVSKAKLKGWI